jgi:transcriptional regulator NrdR family protein
MKNKADVVKQNGHRNTEVFNRKKLHDSIVAACLCVYSPEGQAQTAAKNICDQVEAWVNQHPEVTTDDIRNITANFMEIHHPEAAYLYKQRNITI